MKGRALIILCIALFGISNYAFSQEEPDKNDFYILKVADDSIPFVTLKAVSIVSRSFDDPLDEYKYNQLKYRIEKMWPYYEEAIKTMKEIDDITATSNKKREAKKRKKQLEKEMKERFKNELKELYKSEGKVLVKMIERRTGRSMFDIISLNKSKTSAKFYHVIGKKVGYDLKEGYDPEQIQYFEEIMASKDGTI